MAKNKTNATDVDVMDFINSYVDSEQKRQDSYALIQLMQDITGQPAKMWGPTIIGFGHYHYKYASGHEGDAPLTGFSPRKAAISLYVFTGMDEHQYLLKDLGKYKMGKACIYIKKLTDIDVRILENLIRETISFLNNTYKKE
ncbi:DUF1801 domain-containing protein [Flavobacterium sp. NKUCC04_CG]|uniref:DUF1801 domain-containing protein n=1 Tax=Flavobacterium sp. NKUCC04_CG TaxID=2842121 RepID=UPI001C5B785B|nr:DUF1801 domain-containing protein [Flavobacterium sp. NKUCC04_CG]MBW3519954.1 DUF1801 domain-containing protein [Flavobacterium sp. NKUCC04_CG]